MQRTVVKIYGILVALLAIMGLLGDGLIMGLMNADPALDWLRVALAAFLLYAGFVAKDGKLLRSSLWLVGILYVGMGLLGLMDAELWGLLPSGLTGFDSAYHLVAGLLAIGVAAKKETDHGEVHA